MKSSLLTTALAQINNRSGLKRIIANTGWLFADKFLALLAGLLVGAWIARYLGPTQYGQYNYALAFTALFAPFASLGLATIAVREFVRRPGDKPKILGTVLGLRVAASLLTFGLILVVAHLLRPDDRLMRWLIGIMGARLIFQAFSDTIDYWFQSQVQSKYIVWPKNIALLLVVVINIGLILTGAELTAFAWAALAQAIFLAVGVVVFYWLSGQETATWQFQISGAKWLLRDSWPLILSGMAVVIYMKIDQIMLGELVGEEALGIYSAAVRLSELWYFIPVSLAASVFPAIVRSREQQNAEAYQQRLQLFYDLMALIAYGITIPGAILAAPAIRLLFGPAYADAGPILIVHIWAFIFVSLGIARNKWLITENFIAFSMMSTILGGIVNITINLILIPLYAGLGAAWATLAAYAVASYLSCLFWYPARFTFVQLSRSLLSPFRLGFIRIALYEIFENGGTENSNSV